MSGGFDSREQEKDATRFLKRCLTPCPASRLPLRFESSDRQPMLILEVDLLCQMLAHCLNAVSAEIVVEIPELRLEYPS